MSCPRPNLPRSNPKDVGELAEPLRSRIWTAIKLAPRGRLVPTSLYRDPGRQWDLRHDRCRGRECDSRCKGYPTTGLPAVWNGQEWVGGSKHQHRQAADMGGSDLDWLIRNRAAFGLALTVRGEKWHFEAGGVDVLTGRPCPAPTVRIIPFPSGDTSTDNNGETPKEPLTVAQYDDIMKKLDAIEQEAKAAAVRAKGAEQEATAAASRAKSAETYAKQAVDGIALMSKMLIWTYESARMAYARVRAEHEQRSSAEKKKIAERAGGIDRLFAAQNRREV